MIKVGVAMGPLTWGTWNSTDARTYGASFTGNTFVSGGSRGYFGYGVAVAGSNSMTVHSNNFGGAQFSGKKSTSCYPNTPDPTSVIVNPYASDSLNVQQSGIVESNFLLAICLAPDDA